MAIGSKSWLDEMKRRKCAMLSYSSTFIYIINSCTHKSNENESYSRQLNTHVIIRLLKLLYYIKGYILAIHWNPSPPLPGSAEDLVFVGFSTRRESRKIVYTMHFPISCHHSYVSLSLIKPKRSIFYWLTWNLKSLHSMWSLLDNVSRLPDRPKWKWWMLVHSLQVVLPLPQDTIASDRTLLDV